jgi:pimeloyl-ACP methyl ester carboxylesterase
VPPENQTINVPALMIAAEKDYICRPEMVFQTAEQGKKEGFLPDVQVKQVKTGHWVQLEARQEFFSLLDEFAKGLLESRARI